MIGDIPLRAQPNAKIRRTMVMSIYNQHLQHPPNLPRLTNIATLSRLTTNPRQVVDSTCHSVETVLHLQSRPFSSFSFNPTKCPSRI